MVIPNELRLASSIGLTFAIEAQTIAAPARGDMVRPRAPAKAATLPIFMTSIPNWAACGVTASLKANAAASPEPLISPRINGPKVPPSLAMLALWSANR